MHSMKCIFFLKCLAAYLSEEVEEGCMSNSCLGHVPGMKSNNKGF